MGFVREVRSRETSEAIARHTAGMVRLPASRVRLAPRPCPACRGGSARRGCPCAVCGGAGTTRRLLPGDPSQPVLLQGPCGLGFQRLVAVALADGRPALVHYTCDGPVAAAVYVAAPGRAPAAARGAS